MKASFYFYKGKLQTLPKGVFLLIILFILLLIPLLASIFIVTATTTLIFKSIYKLFVPGKSTQKIEYTTYEIVDDKKENKQINKLNN
jgi:hypothetical protein